MATTRLQTLRALGVFLLVAVGAVVGLWAVARLWPLPKGQGLAYVAHPFWALIGGGLSAVGALIACLKQPARWGWWLAGALALTWGISALIFLSA